MSYPAGVPSLDESFRELTDADDQTRFLALRAIRDRTEAARSLPGVVPALIARLLDRCGPVADLATQTLEALGEVGVAALVDATQAPDPALRRMAVHGLGRRGSSPERRVAALLAALDDRDADVQRAACWALSNLRKFHPETHGAQPPALAAELARRLTADLVSGEPFVRAWSAHELGMLGPAAPVPLDALARATLSDPDEKVRHDAAWALGYLGRSGSSDARRTLEALASTSSIAAEMRHIMLRPR